jgi:tight adherence protein B
VTDALEVAARETRAPLGTELAEVLGRIRLGDDPKEVFQDFSSRIPLEGYRLLSFSLLVHWEVGGSLARTLASIGRTVRDRLEVQRRVRAQSAEAQFSVLGVLAITYLIGLITWTSYPERLTRFFASEIGTVLLVLTVLLQAAGLLWMHRISRISV